jgi:hypothetical protein
VIHVGTAEIGGELRLKLHVVQGRPEVLSLGLSGDGEVVDVSGQGLRDWSVRQGTTGQSGRRFLDVRPLLSPGVPDPRDFELVIHTRLKKPAVPGASTVLIVTPGDAVGFASQVSLQLDPSVDVRVTAAPGMVPLDEPVAGSRSALQFHSTVDGRIELALAASALPALIAPPKIIIAMRRQLAPLIIVVAFILAPSELKSIRLEPGLGRGGETRPR